MKINSINLDVGYQDMDDMPTFTGDPLSVARAVNFAISGLLNDGGHHKQWALEQVLESLGIDLKELRSVLMESENEDEQYDWEDGIAP